MNYNENNLEKYLKYTAKINMMSGGRFICDPNKNFDDICIENTNGKYRNKSGCINDCEGKYIMAQLTNAKMTHETSKFYKFVKEIIKTEKIDVYIKGGNVIGLEILRMIHEEYKDDDKKFEKYFYKFLELELIKDWDFASYVRDEKNITEEYRKKLDKIAKDFNLVPRAKTFILYQTKKPILTEDKALFEISILEKDKYSNLEIPLTTMKTKITEHNIKYIFMFAKKFHMYREKNEQFDINLIKHLISKINISMHPHRNGLYDISPKSKDFDGGNLNDELLNFLKKYEKYDVNLVQFFVTHISDLFRLLYRLPEKNIPKTKKIQKFIKDTFDKKNTSWLFNPEFMQKITEEFTEDFGEEISKIYKNYGFDNVLKFIDGIYWNRIVIEYNKLITDYGKKLLNNMLKKLVKTMGNKEIEKLDDDKGFKTLLKFLIV